MNTIYLGEDHKDLQRVYADYMPKTFLKKEDILRDPESFRNTRYIFSTWGMPVFTEEEIKAFLPSLKAVFYAAGSVQKFARPFLNCGIKVFSAWAANGVPVAEYTVAQIILANKGFFQASQLASTGDRSGAKARFSTYPGNYAVRVGIIGAGMIGKMVIKRLKEYALEVVTFDPFLPEETAQALGVQKVSLQELFATSQVVSNHLANNAQTKGMLNYALFSTMLPNATFLNTGRGAQVVENDLIAVLRERPDLTAVLDVTYPEPPAPDSPFYTLPNCFLTPHIAGSSGNEVRRMASYMMEEYEAFTIGKPCRFEVTEKMLETMA
jgi:phosphoglycerate dehydrogenase-like enzyme